MPAKKARTACSSAAPKRTAGAKASARRPKTSASGKDKRPAPTVARKRPTRPVVAALATAGAPAAPAEPGSWEFMYRMLAVFQRTHGHCDVSYVPRRDSLGFWLMQQRLAELAGDLPPALRLKLLRLGVEFDHHDLAETKRERRWNEMFDALQEFKQGAGHCRVPCGRPEFAALYTWFHAQRHLARTGKLRADRHRRLASCGVNLERQARQGSRGVTPQPHRQQVWEIRIKQLIAFREQHGHCRVLLHRGEHRSLGVWLMNQRQAARKNRLPEERRAELVRLGVDFRLGGTKAAGWTDRFTELQRFKEQHGHCDVPRAGPVQSRLANWVCAQRSRARAGKLLPESRRLLEELGVCFESRRHDHEAWDRMFAQLAAYRQAHGDCDVPKHSREHGTLASWVYTQRMKARQGHLLAVRRQRLAELGLALPEADLDSPQAWNLMHRDLQGFHARFGHSDVPRHWNEPPGLYQWLVRQRRAARAGALSAGRRDALAALGVKAHADFQSWEERFSQLLQFNNTHGHCRVSAYLHGNPALANWVAQQRQFRRRGLLTEERIQKLGSLHFDWNPPRVNQVQLARWEQQFSECALLTRQQGHGRIPSDLPENPALGQWAAAQRSHRRRGKLSPDRLMRLEALGFDWDPPDPRWDARFAALLRFKDVFGHCHVSSSFEDDPSLGTWVSTQRADYRSGLLAPERIQRLEALGFAWRPARRSRFSYDRQWEQRFRQLQEFKGRFGHCFVPQAWPRIGRWEPGSPASADCTARGGFPGRHFPGRHVPGWRASVLNGPGAT